jgi:hypothetical protein
MKPAVKPVQRSEIVDYVTYEEDRDAFRVRVIEAKAVRRVHIGGHLTLLFENPLTIRYQIQEMIRAERIVKEADIRHEIDTYNELLGGEGELGCTMLIEIDDPASRDEKLKEWRDLPGKVYLLLEDGTRVWATFDERQRGETQLSSVQYLRFDTGGRIPVAAGSALPALNAETLLTQEQRAALREDLSS